MPIEFHCEVDLPSWFQCRASFWLANSLLDSSCFLDVSQMALAIKESAGKVCHSFEAFSRGYVLLEIISFLAIILKLF